MVRIRAMRIIVVRVCDRNGFLLDQAIETSSIPSLLVECLDSESKASSCGMWPSPWNYYPETSGCLIGDVMVNQGDCFLELYLLQSTPPTALSAYLTQSRLNPGRIDLHKKRQGFFHLQGVKG